MLHLLLRRYHQECRLHFQQTYFRNKLIFVEMRIRIERFCFILVRVVNETESQHSTSGWDHRTGPPMPRCPRFHMLIRSVVVLASGHYRCQQ